VLFFFLLKRKLRKSWCLLVNLNKREVKELFKKVVRTGVTVAAGGLLIPSVASADWTPLITSSTFTGATTDVLTAVTAVLGVWVILWAAGALMGKL
jgi:hypothetical protein